MKADQYWPGLVIRNGTGGKTLVFTDKHGVALEGYDPTTYFADGKPMKGDPKIEATYNGALYHFVSQANRETFEKAPSKYAPARLVLLKSLVLPSLTRAFHNARVF